MMRRSFLLVAAALLTLSVAPAHAAGELELSRDGVTWATDLVEPLFDSSVRWVPGDVRAESFFVRNDSAQSGRLSIDIMGSPVHTLLDTGDLDIDARGAGGAWVSVSTPGTHRLLSQGQVPAGDARRVDVTVHFDAASTNESQLKSVELAFRVGLVQDTLDESDGSKDAGEGDDTNDATGLLPDAGGPPLWWALCGLMMLGLGVSGIRRAPRRQVTT
jgi:hypothetical protein